MNTTQYDINTLIAELEAVKAENQRITRELNTAMQQLDLAVSSAHSKIKAKRALIVCYNDFMSQESGRMWDSNNLRTGALTRLTSRVSDYIKAGGRLNEVDSNIKTCYDTLCREHNKNWISEEDLRLSRCLVKFAKEYLYGGGEEYRSGDKALAMRLLKTHKQLRLRLGEISRKSRWGMRISELEDIEAAVNMALETYHLYSWYARVKLSPYRQVEKIDELVDLRGILGVDSIEGRFINQMIDYYEGDYYSETAKMKNVLAVLNQMRSEGKDLTVFTSLFTDTLMNEIAADIETFKDKVYKVQVAEANKLIESNQLNTALSYLTERQKQIAMMSAAGYRVGEITEILGISQKLCSKERNNIRKALKERAV